MPQIHEANGSGGPTCVQHQPHGAYTRDKDGQPADLLNIRDYPIRAVCMMCEAKIITYGLYGRAADWYDVTEQDSKVNGILGLGGE